MSQSPSDPRVQRVSEQRLRELFNESNVPAMIADGRLRAQLPYLRHNHLSQETCLVVREPYCTHSQVIRYFNQNGRWVVEVHQYLRSDGTLGASGRPDPKRLRLGGVIYTIARD